MSLVPIFGSILSSVPIVAIALTQSLGVAVEVLLWIVGIHQLEANFLNPKIIGDQAHIHPVLVVFSLLGRRAFLWAAGRAARRPGAVHRAVRVPALPLHHVRRRRPGRTASSLRRRAIRRRRRSSAASPIVRPHRSRVTSAARLPPARARSRSPGACVGLGGAPARGPRTGEAWTQTLRGDTLRAVGTSEWTGPGRRYVAP